MYRGSDQRKGGMCKTKISKTIQIENTSVAQHIISIFISSTYYYSNLQYQKG